MNRDTVLGFFAATTVIAVVATIVLGISVVGRPQRPDTPKPVYKFPSGTMVTHAVSGERGVVVSNGHDGQAYFSSGTVLVSWGKNVRYRHVEAELRKVDEEMGPRKEHEKR